MALQAALPPSDSKEFRRSELLKRLAQARTRAEARRPGRRGQAPLAWDPAELLGVSPSVMLVICAVLGASLGVLTFGTFQVASREEPLSLPPRPAALQPGMATEAPSLFVTVADLPAPARAIDDYYFYLRQGMLNDAWDLTDEHFRATNYAAGPEAYQGTWSGAQAIEVLSLDLVWQSQAEAHVVGEIQEGGSDLRWRNIYVLNFDEATSSWKIHSIDPAG